MSASSAFRRRAAALLAIVALAGGCGRAEPQPSAAEQVTALTPVLHRVDSALADHRFAAARQQLKKLRSQVVAARDAGELDETDAEPILDAITRLLSMLPTATPSESPSVASPSTTDASKPSAPKSSRTSRPQSTAPTPEVSPSATPTPTTSSSPSPTESQSSGSDPTPTDSATRDAGTSPSPSPVGG